MIIIAGFPRSGTSFLAMFFKRLGYDVGGSWIERINGGFEAGDTSHIFSLVEKKNPDEEVLKAIKKIKRNCFKSPVFTREHGVKVMELWHKVHPDMDVLLTYRKPSSSRASFRKAKNKDYPLDEKEMQKCWDNIENILIKLNIKHSIFIFPEFLNSYDIFYKSIDKNTEIVYDYDKGKKIWESMVDKNKVHYK